MSEICQLCRGHYGVRGNVYFSAPGGYMRGCPRCGGSGVEPDAAPLHAGLLLRNRRSGLVWALYGDYPDGVWGLHRMIPARVRGGHYVWQIILRPAAELLDPRRWRFAGCGDAWNHELMEARPLRARAESLPPVSERR